MATYSGSDSPESFAGTFEDDVMIARGGDDSLYAWDGNDRLYAGSGNDAVYAGSGDDLAYGGAGDDTVQGGLGADTLYGGSGDDWIVVNYTTDASPSVAYGGDGNDEVMFFGGGGGGQAYGGGGLDVLSLMVGGDNALTVDLANQTLDGHGSYVGVTFAGFEALDIISGSGNDVILAGAADDKIVVGTGDNLVQAGDGNDIVSYGTRGTSTLDGGAGQDTLWVDAGGSALYFIFDISDGSIDDGQLSVLTGFEHFAAAGSVFADIAGLGTGNDSFKGYDGDDSAFGYAGNDQLIGDAGGDYLDGGSGLDQLFGGAGNDSLIGGADRDLLAGGRGDDLMDGGDGRDRIYLSLGNDTATGGSGVDSFIFNRSGWGFVTLTDFQTGIDQLQYFATSLQFGPPAGVLDPALLSFGAASGSNAQFVLTYDADTDKTSLVWDPNGDNPAGGVFLAANFTGQVDLVASDILIL